MTLSPARLRAAAALIGTPCYVYDLDTIRDRFAQLRASLGECRGISYAIKA